MENKNKYVDYGWRYKFSQVTLFDDKIERIDDLKFLNQLTIAELSTKFFFAERCMQCGLCNIMCPYSLIEDTKFLPRYFIQKARLGLLNLESDDIWFCTNCGSCEIKCPFDIKMVEIINDIRRIVFDYGAGYIPESIKKAAVAIKSSKNPWKEDQELRYKDIKKGNEIEITNKSSSEERLIFSCCFNHYDLNGKRILSNSINLLQKAGLICKYLNEFEYCCGDTLLRSGDLNGFNMIKEENINTIKAAKTNKIIAISPHCFHILKNYYFKDDLDFIIYPLIEELYEILKNEKIKIKNKLKDKVTFHDPCFLCKHNDYGDMFRGVINLLCDNLVEMEHHGVNSICCGGGGCGIWIDSKKGQRLVEKRLKEALDINAKVIITACPICFNMLESCIIDDNEAKDIKIRDITDIIIEAIN